MLVSILIPCYNAERWIRQCIESGLGQTWSEKEIVVVDDGSTDSSLDIIESFGRRIRWESGPHRGGNAARNRLLELARGDWLQYLDADDYLLPDKIAKQVNFIATHPEAEVVFGPVTVERWSKGEVHRELLPIQEPLDLWVLLARWSLPQTGSSLWRKQAVVDVGGWKPDQPCCQEHELYLRLLMAGKRLAYCASNGAVYRQWGDHTVCKRDTREVRRRRLAIEQHIENFLSQRGEFTHARRWAVNQARLEIARTAWPNDRAEARLIAAMIVRSYPDFTPAGAAAPHHYGVMYRLLGFEPTELLAEWRRRVFGIPKAT